MRCTLKTNCVSSLYRLESTQHAEKPGINIHLSSWYKMCGHKGLIDCVVVTHQSEWRCIYNGAHQHSELCCSSPTLLAYCIFLGLSWKWAPAWRICSSQPHLSLQRDGGVASQETNTVRIVSYRCMVGWCSICSSHFPVFDDGFLDIKNITL